MTREQFIEMLNENDVHYEEYTEKGMDQVWIFSRKEFELKKRHPRTYKDLYVPYLRVSHFNERDKQWYTKENGWTSWMNIKDVINKVLTELNNK